MCFHRRNELSDSEAQAERLQAEVKALQQQHADTVSSLEEQHLKALLDSEEQQHEGLSSAKQQHAETVQALKVKSVHCFAECVSAILGSLGHT